MTPGFDLAGGDRAMIAEQLAQLLADTLLVAVRTREAAWHLQGAPLLSLQAELLSQSDGLVAALDALSARVRVLGFLPPEPLATGLARRLAAAQTEEDAAVAPGIRIASLASDHDDLAGSLRFLRPVLRDVDDGATALLVDARLAVHEAAADRLRSLVAAGRDEARRYERLLAGND